MASGSRKLGWSEFAGAIAGVANVPPASVQPATRLLEDMNLDSLALTEVIGLLLVDMEMASLEAELSRRDWRQVTVGELFHEYQQGVAPGVREQVVIRTEPRR